MLQPVNCVFNIGIKWSTRIFEEYASANYQKLYFRVSMASVTVLEYNPQFLHVIQRRCFSSCTTCSVYSVVYTTRGVYINVVHQYLYIVYFSINGYVLLDIISLCVSPKSFFYSSWFFFRFLLFTTKTSTFYY